MIENELPLELLNQIAYQSWLDRGQPFGSPEVDWEFAKQELGLHAPVTVVSMAITSVVASTRTDPELIEQLDRTDDA